MRKIPTIFDREGNFIENEPHPDCDWVFNGEGVATEKLDGFNVRLTIRQGECVRAEKRRNPTKEQKFRGIIDPWYVDITDDPAGKWLLNAVQNTKTVWWPSGGWSAEAIGPKIQGNPLDLLSRHCVPFSLFRPCILDIVSTGMHAGVNTDVPVYVGYKPTFEGFRDFLFNLDSVYSPDNLAEGLVFHHKDGRMAKIKRKDFFYG